MEQETKTPGDWCREMQDKAKDGEAAYNYHRMAELWDKRGQE